MGRREKIKVREMKKTSSTSRNYSSRHPYLLCPCSPTSLSRSSSSLASPSEDSNLPQPPLPSHWPPTPRIPKSSLPSRLLTPTNVTVKREWKRNRPGYTSSNRAINHGRLRIQVRNRAQNAERNTGRGTIRK